MNSYWRVGGRGNAPCCDFQESNHNFKKVKFTLEEAMKFQRVSTDIVLLFL
jgi:hypothetical protein